MALAVLKVELWLAPLFLALIKLYSWAPEELLHAGQRTGLDEQHVYISTRVFVLAKVAGQVQTSPALEKWEVIWNISYKLWSLALCVFSLLKRRHNQREREWKKVVKIRRKKPINCRPMKQVVTQRVRDGARP